MDYKRRIVKKSVSWSELARGSSKVWIYALLMSQILNERSDSVDKCRELRYVPLRMRTRNDNGQRSGKCRWEIDRYQYSWDCHSSRTNHNHGHHNRSLIDAMFPLSNWTTKFHRWFESRSFETKAQSHSIRYYDTPILEDVTIEYLGLSGEIEYDSIPQMGKPILSARSEFSVIVTNTALTFSP
jgi:hypothetical protein